MFRRSRKTDSDMTVGVEWKHILGFSVPMAIGLLFQQFYNTVDTIVVGQYVGRTALAAVGSTGSIINTMVGVCAGLATGASVVIAQDYGAHDRKSLSHAVHTSIVLTFLLTIFATAIGVGAVDAMLGLMDTPEDVFAEAKEYLTIYFTGIGGLLFYNMGSGILRAVGDSRRPLYFLIFSAVTNIVLDLVFVICFHMGTAGVAWATVISQVLSAGLVLFSLSNPAVPYGIHWRHLHMEKQALRRILAIGLPSSIQQAITAFSNVFVQSYINAFGSACMAGWSAYNKLDAFLSVPMQSLGLAATTFVGQNYGAGEMLRAKRGARQSMAMSVGITAALELLMVAARRPLLSMFTTDPEVLDYGAYFVLVITLFYVFMALSQVLAGALRGIGVAKRPVLAMIGSYVVFRQAYLYIGKTLGGGIFEVSLAYPAGWVVCSAVLFLLYTRTDLWRGGRKQADTSAGQQAPAEPAQD